jgi:hypothetical protein
MTPRRQSTVRLLGALIALGIFPSRFADSGLLPNLSPLYDVGKWQAQMVMSPNSVNIRVTETTIVERQNAVCTNRMLYSQSLDEEAILLHLSLCFQGRFRTTEPRMQERRMYRDVPYSCEVRDFVVYVNQYPVSVCSPFQLPNIPNGADTPVQHTQEILPYDGETGPFVRLGFIAWPDRCTILHPVLAQRCRLPPPPMPTLHTLRRTTPPSNNIVANPPLPPTSQFPPWASA